MRFLARNLCKLGENTYYCHNNAAQWGALEFHLYVSVRYGTKEQDVINSDSLHLRETALCINICSE
jgi:hypothetical protein